jgi:site-specific DNA recombinase
MLPSMSTRPTEWSAPDAGPGDPLWRVYARLSDEGEADITGVDRQIEDGIDYARRRGARRVQIYADDGISAYKRGIRRDAFEEMLEDVAAQRAPCGPVVAWKVERLARQPRDAERLLDILRADEDPPHAICYTINDGGDTSTAAGKFLFRAFVQFGQWESQSIAARVKRAHRQAIERGGYTGSPPAYGHMDGQKWSKVEPQEAANLRAAADRIVAGDSVGSIIRDWTARGILTRNGNGWQHHAWIKIITNPRMAGLRRVRGVVTRGVDAAGQPLIAPVLDEETWLEVCRILQDPARRPAHPGGGEPRHLLTGLMRCGSGVCTGLLRAKGYSGKDGKGGGGTQPGAYWTYSCVRDAYHMKSCAKIHIKGEPTDRLIEGLVLAALKDPAVKEALTRAVSVDLPQVDGAERGTEEDLQVEFLVLQERIVATEAAFMEGPAELERQFSISPEGYHLWRKRALERRDELERQISRSARGKIIVSALADPVAYWQQATLEQKRDVIRLVMPEITVIRAKSLPEYPQRWDDRRIVITPLGA